MTATRDRDSGGYLMSSTTIYTVGTALRRAHDNELAVSVLVEGNWIEGQIGGLDGDGVLLTSPDDVQSVVRLASIAVVRVQAPAGTTADLQEERLHPGPDPLTDYFDASELPSQRAEDVEPDWTARRDWGASVALSVVAAAAQ